ncbi:MAG: secondary thiamine-phosphate synthase enzyme YjbQ [Candidatus Dormibacteria bacterium]
MAVHNEAVRVPAGRSPRFLDLTQEVEAVLARSGIRDGVAVAFSQHTTCSVLIQEASDDTDYWGTEFLMQDLVTALEKIIPTCRTEGQFQHPGPKHVAAGRARQEEASWSLNTDAHLRSVLLRRSETVPVVEGRLVLGEFGRIYFADFDHTRARERVMHVQILGE